ncbi:SDR family oxidoreductase [Nonomuraea endophytica]|uniref:NAD(P)-dependent dehydrogenase (Short-subunit alcohol dehydrogenase family) n=1 Tax=Nonomuraea endophytica TaxID=714136 RepID=A0A7W8A088_9ACTN|nr:SDR family oxidoreductase [Nonomuraea endophytica]MBB5077128.1 NAD(P)-dependent dehydrogenase (short-subunit alcohol dehydrogenase family) [Nonomuraea endophytica]
MTAPALIVTGATGGLGPAVVSRLAERGDRLLLTGRDKARLAELGKEYDVETLATDVSDPAGAREAAEAALAAFGRIDGLVHLVGGFRAGPYFLMDPAAYEGMLRDNFLSAVTATQALLPHLTDGGRLVYFSTPLADEPMPALSAYAASKAALVAWVRSIAHELKRGGVHANVVSMTMADTPQKRRERPDLDTDHMVAPELVARVVAFLTSAESDGLYGSVVPVLGRFEFTSELSGRPPR